MYADPLRPPLNEILTGRIWRQWCTRFDIQGPRSVHNILVGQGVFSLAHYLKFMYPYCLWNSDRAKSETKPKIKWQGSRAPTLVPPVDSGVAKHIIGLTGADEGDGLRPTFYTFSSKYIITFDTRCGLFSNIRSITLSF